MKDLLIKSGALVEGHFLLSSSRHSKTYIQCAQLLKDPKMAELALRPLAESLSKLEIDCVVGPAMGGLIVSYELARQLGKISMFTEREEGQMKFRRGFKMEKSWKVLIAEDVVTTGKSALEAIKAVEEGGGEVVGIACLVKRGNPDLDYPIFASIDLPVEDYDEKDCPLCREGLGLLKPGSRKEIRP